MKAIDKLIESFEIMIEEEIEWIDVIKSKKQAYNLFKKINKNEIDEYDIIRLSDVLGIEIENYSLPPFLAIGEYIEIIKKEYLIDDNSN